MDGTDVTDSVTKMSQPGKELGAGSDVIGKETIFVYIW